MPWHIDKRNNEFCVIKDDDGEVEGCHPVRAEAERQLAALYASETDAAIKEEPMEEAEVKATWTTAYVNNLPDGAFLHILSGGEKDSEGKTAPRSLRMFPYKNAEGAVDLPHLRNALARIPQSNRIDGATKRQLLARGRRILSDQQKETEGLLDRLARAVKGLFTPLAPEPPAQGFSLWKEGDVTRWLAVYSNNYRDDDHPPEILAAQAHRDFVKAVDDGEWPAPELWFWHVEGTRFGQADLVAYAEDSGMSLAAGTVDKGMEPIAQYCVEQGYSVSHGMPTETIRRDEADPTVITAYRTKEISVLPAWAAANKHTAFVMLKENDDMQIPEHKREELAAAGFDPNAISAKLDEEKAEAEAEGRESKELEPEVKADETKDVGDAPQDVGDTPAAVTEPAAEPVTGAVSEPPPVFDMATVASAIGEVITSQMQPVLARMEALEASINEVKEAHAAEKAERELTPAASLAALIKSSVIGHEETRVDGRSSEAKDTPKETQSVKSQIGIPFIDQMMSGRDWRDGFKSD